MLHLYLLLEEWERLDEAAYLAERLLDLALDDYCEGTGPAPSPAEAASVKRLRFLATERLTSIRQAILEA
jgi:hypothetical protein